MESHPIHLGQSWVALCPRSPCSPNCTGVWGASPQWYGSVQRPVPPLRASRWQRLSTYRSFATARAREGNAIAGGLAQACEAERQQTLSPRELKDMSLVSSARCTVAPSMVISCARWPFSMPHSVDPTPGQPCATLRRIRYDGLPDEALLDQPPQTYSAHGLDVSPVEPKVRACDNHKLPRIVCSEAGA